MEDLTTDVEHIENVERRDEKENNTKDCKRRSI